MRNRFDRQLEQLHVELMEMGSMCEEVIRKTSRVLETGEKEMARDIRKEDARIDEQERLIESLCLKLLLQQQPVAKDLRKVSAALKMITDMERIGDQASDIAEISKIIIEEGRGINEDMKKMAHEAVKMVTDSVDSFVKRDLDLARKVIAYDDVVDDWFSKMKKEVIDLITKDSYSGEYSIDLLMIAKYLERIGDHATNIAEWVEYSITGTRSHNN